MMRDVGMREGDGGQQDKGGKKANNLVDIVELKCFMHEHCINRGVNQVPKSKKIKNKIHHEHKPNLCSYRYFIYIGTVVGVSYYKLNTE